MASHSKRQIAQARPLGDEPAASPVWHPDLAAETAPRFSAEQHVGTALRETFRAFARSLSHNLSGFDLTLNMWFVLRALWERDDLAQVDLARRLEVTPAAIVGLVNSLEKLGLVERQRSPTDGRSFRVHLTPKGNDLRVKATAQALQVDAKALRGLSVADVETLLRLMSRLRSNLADQA
jgi:DNA-binding MarR family transcriptional regulator